MGILYALSDKDNACTQILLKTGANIHYKMPKNLILLHVGVQDKLKRTVNDYKKDK